MEFEIRNDDNEISEEVILEIKGKEKEMFLEECKKARILISKLTKKELISPEFEKKFKHSGYSFQRNEIFGFCNNVILFCSHFVYKKDYRSYPCSTKKYYVTDGKNLEKINTPMRYINNVDDSEFGILKYLVEKNKLENEVLIKKIKKFSIEKREATILCYKLAE